jgi:hypothetical protein
MMETQRVSEESVTNGSNYVVRLSQFILNYFTCYLVHKFRAEPTKEAQFKHCAYRMQEHPREHQSLRWHLHRQENIIVKILSTLSACLVWNKAAAKHDRGGMQLCIRLVQQYSYVH